MPIESLHQAALTKRARGRSPAAGDERRKCDRMIALWQRYRGDDDVPMWSESFLNDARDLGDYCMVGATDLQTSAVSIEEIGANFRRHLDTSRENWSDTGASAAVLVKEIVEAANWLQANVTPGPIDHEYPDHKIKNRTVKSRFVVLPFIDEAPGRLRWVALGDWCSQES
ncbi:MAG: hypothetical protein OEQ29_13440 [Alphaproteobacteria bacterium]|nr:hypothetical protein [Alphaproteobacteria bacterium]